MKTRYVFLCVIAVVAFALVGGFAIGQESVVSPMFFSNERLSAALDARTNAYVDIDTLLPVGSGTINGLDKSLVLRVAPHSVVMVFGPCDLAVRATVLKSPNYHQPALARYCAERKSSKP